MLNPVLGTRDPAVNKKGNDSSLGGTDIFLAKTDKKEKSRVKFIEICKEEKSSYVRGRIW